MTNILCLPVQLMSKDQLSLEAMIDRLQINLNNFYVLLR